MAGTMRAADAAVRVLERFGVRYAFCVPGESFLGLLDALRDSAIQVIATRHEGGAAALVRDAETPVVALAGDGGFLMTGSELAVAAQHGLRLACIVFNNAMYGTIRMHQEREYPSRVSATDLWSPDFARYAEAFGGLGIRIDDNRDVADAVQAIATHRGIAVLEVTVSQDAIAVGQTLAGLRAGRAVR